MGKNTVRVIGRLRPTDAFASDVMQLQDDQKTINVHTGKRAAATEWINNTAEDHAFKLDLLLKDTSQETVYDLAAADVVKSVMAGYNGTVMCYGQTGAGKTYTMMGGNDYRTRGVVPRAIKSVYDEIQSQPERAYDVKVSFIEVYMERIRDLLDPTSTEDFAIQEDSKGNITVRGVQHRPCSQEAEALALLFEGNTNRTTSEHSLNGNSSRSHCIFSIHVTSRSRVESESASIVSKLHLIDLAGSERLSKTASDGQLMKEAQFINKSLTFLEQVVMSLGTQGRTHVPFRQSRLTNLLKDSLGGNSKTTMIANVWPEARHVEESMSTFKFATRMMQVQTDATVNVVVDPQTQIKQLQKQITELKGELQMQNQLMGRSHIRYEGEIGEDERFEIEKTVQNYVDGSLAEIPIRSLREVKEYFKVFKAFVDTRDAEARATQAATGGAGGVSVQPAPPAAPKQGRGSTDGVGAIEPTNGMSIGVAAPSKNLRDVVKSPQSPPRRGSVAPGTMDHSPERSEAPGAPTTEGPPSVAAVPDMPDKNTAFADYKSAEGLRTVNAIKETSRDLAAKKSQCADLSRRINDLKIGIDDANAELEQRRLDRQARGEDEVVDDEEFELVRVAKDRKMQYRQLYDELTNAKAERDTFQRAAESLKERLLSGFEDWFDSVYGGAAKQAKIQSGLRTMRGISGTKGVDDDDALDEGEKFEMLELNRVMNEDPDSVAYYSAKKMTQSTKTATRRNQALAHSRR